MFHLQLTSFLSRTINIQYLPNYVRLAKNYVVSLFYLFITFKDVCLIISSFLGLWWLATSRYEHKSSKDKNLHLTLGKKWARYWDCFHTCLPYLWGTRNGTCIPSTEHILLGRWIYGLKKQGNLGVCTSWPQHPTGYQCQLWYWSLEYKDSA